MGTRRTRFWWADLQLCADDVQCVATAVAHHIAKLDIPTKNCSYKRHLSHLNRVGCRLG